MGAATHQLNCINLVKSKPRVGLRDEVVLGYDREHEQSNLPRWFHLDTGEFRSENG